MREKWIRKMNNAQSLTISFELSFYLTPSVVEIGKRKQIIESCQSQTRLVYMSVFYWSKERENKYNCEFVSSL